MRTHRHPLRRLAAVAAAAVATSLVTAGAPAHATTVTTPPPPTLVAPADSRGTDQPALKSPVLSWTPVAGARSYEVALSPNEDWTNNTVTLPSGGATVNTLYELPMSLPHASYFWRVRAVLTSGARTTWSSDRVLMRDWDDAPTAVSSPSASDPRFVWTPVTWASVYQLQVSKTPYFSSDDTHFCDTAQTSFAPYDPAAGETHAPGTCFPRGDLATGTYYWRVIALDDSRQPAVPSEIAPVGNGYGCPQVPECSGTSNVLQVDYTAPTAGAVAGAPANLVTSCSACHVTPSLSWDPVSGAGYYEVRVGVDPTFSNVQRVYKAASAAVTPRDTYLDGQAGKAYYVIVRGCNDTTCGPWSQVTTFTKSSPAAVASSPASGSVLTTNQVTFSWQDYLATTGTQEALDYRLELAQDPYFESGDRIVDHVDLTRWTDPAAHLADGTWWWRVQARDESGNLLTWSASRTVSVDTVAPSVRVSAAVPTGRSPLTVVASEPLVGAHGAATGVPATLGVVAAGSTAPVAGTLTALSATAWRFTPSAPWVAGQRYQAWAAAGVHDVAGHPVGSWGSAVRASTLVDSSSVALVKVAGDAPWRTSTASDARGGSLVWSSDLASTSRRSEVHTTVAGTRVYLDGCRSPQSGRASVLVDGVRLATLDLYRSYSGCGLVWVSPALTARAHTVVVQLLGTKNSASKGTVVSVDAIRVA